MLVSMNPKHINVLEVFSPTDTFVKREMKRMGHHNIDTLIAIVCWCDLYNQYMGDQRKDFVSLNKELAIKTLKTRDREEVIAQLRHAAKCRKADIEHYSEAAGERGDWYYNTAVSAMYQQATISCLLIEFDA